MPVKKSTAKTKRTQAASKASNKNRGIGIAVVVAGLLLGGFFFYWALTGTGDNMGEKAKIASYLQGRYSRNFTVDEIKTVRPGFGVSSYIKAKVYPTNDPSLTFEVTKHTTGKAETFSDDFLSAYWEKSELPVITRRLENTLTSEDRVKLSIGYTYGADENKFSGVTKYEDLSSPQLKEISYSVILYKELDSSITNEQNRQKTIELVSQTVEYLQTSGTGKPHVTLIVKGLNTPNGSYPCQLPVATSTSEDNVQKCVDETFTYAERGKK